MNTPDTPIQSSTPSAEASDPVAGRCAVAICSAFPLAHKEGLSLMLGLLAHQGAICPNCGHGTRVKGKKWAECKKCSTRVERRDLPSPGIAPCPACRGYELESQWCDHCKRAGYVPSPNAGDVPRPESARTPKHSTTEKL